MRYFDKAVESNGRMSSPTRGTREALFLIERQPVSQKACAEVSPNPILLPLTLSLLLLLIRAYSPLKKDKDNVQIEFACLNKSKATLCRKQCMSIGKQHERYIMSTL